MKITKTKLRQIIKEELSSVLNEFHKFRQGQDRPKDRDTIGKAQTAGAEDYHSLKTDKPTDRGDEWETFEDGLYLDDYEGGYRDAEEMDEYAEYQDSDDYER